MGVYLFYIMLGSDRRGDYMADKIEPQERENMIHVLEWKTNYTYDALNKLTDEQLNKLYNERVG
jgi:hypothetical protein